MSNLFSHNNILHPMVGTELNEAIKEAVQYCKDNNTFVLLEFNATINRVESWIDPKEFSKVWFKYSGDEYCQSQRCKMRDNKLNELGI